ncbi:hypothetical protein E5720_20685 [Rhodococcus sp. PAMC28707]|uniref:MmyB family transcriptional regulator n=1 Tax=unclassified Rhodococcus (in: high G+C Gram-positive bacteria) TaxID=192944 RepID=UPI00109E1691|nr:MULTISPECIES: hypothetical protein [unclassified Rhodococcus (in: high G+C Gram-positive bacteria)]QCB51303.1 hypothetical protein E5769_14840 [Rhodococcus sp. PAMC28705]QCB60529.1 hypothetical protein E5720_20685 [Rhodococcus sp. PAMC28707]
MAWRFDGAELRREIDPALRRSMESWDRSVAFVLAPVLDISAMYSPGGGIVRTFSDTRNLVETVFCDPPARTIFADWGVVYFPSRHANRTEITILPTAQAI